jgi:tripartite-type tricarboxylate transporter receptor subunit TctC
MRYQCRKSPPAKGGISREDSLIRTRRATALALMATAALATAAPALFGTPANAQDYPNRTITLVVPYPPSGGVDVMARVMAEKLAVALKTQVIVDNRGGGGGNIGTRSVARSTPDGYTLLLGHTGTMAINPSLYSNPGYDIRKDFTGVGLIAAMPVALLAHPTFPANTVGEMIALMKQDPAKYNLGTSAIGTGSYLSSELFKSMAGLEKTQLVPYRGTGPLMNDLLGNHIPVAFGVLPPALGNLAAGKLKALAVTGKTRFSGLPDVPTVDATGLQGFEAVLRYGIVAPAGTPKPIIDRLNKEIRAIVASDDVKKRINNEGGDPLTSSPEEHTVDLDREEAKWSKVIRTLKLKVE